jgi:hypothetical protein
VVSGLSTPLSVSKIQGQPELHAVIAHGWLWMLLLPESLFTQTIPDGDVPDSALGKAPLA